MSLFSKAKADMKYLKMDSRILSDIGKKKKRRAISTLVGLILCLIFAITILLVLAKVLPLNLIPQNYLYIGIIVIVLLWLYSFISQLSRFKWPGKVIAVVLSIVLIAVFMFSSKFSSTLNKISGGITHQQDVMDVVVLKTDTAENLGDLTKSPFAYHSSSDEQLSQNAIKIIEDKYKTDIFTTSYSSWEQLFEKLQDGTDVRAIIIKDSIYTTLIKDSYKEFFDNTKVIDKIAIKTKLKVSANTKKVTQEPFVLYISGNDEQGEIKSTGRSDVNIFMVVNPKTKQVLLVSTPRDSYVTISNADGVTGKDKLTHAGLAGIEYSQEALSKLYNEKIDYYMKINFTGIINLVNAMGGITVYSDIAFRNGYDAAPIRYKFEKGPNECDGLKALAFCRERQAFDDGDFQRGRNQMLVLDAMIKKLTSPSIIADYSKVLDAATGLIYTNMPANEITSLIKLQFSNGSGWNIQSYSTEGEPSTANAQVYGLKGVSVVKLNPKSVELAENMIDMTLQGKIFNVDEYVKQNSTIDTTEDE